MATFWEIAAHLVGHILSLSFIYLYFYLFPILVLRAGFGILIATDPVHYFSITFVPVSGHCLCVYFTDLVHFS